MGIFTSVGHHAADALAIVRPKGSDYAQLSRSAERVANCCESEVALASRHPQANEKELVANGSSRVMAMVTAAGHFTRYNFTCLDWYAFVPKSAILVIVILSNIRIMIE